MTNKEASDIIEAAFNQVLDSIEDREDGDILVDWILIGCTANPDQEKGYGYQMFFANGLMPGYRSRGLLVTALEILKDI